MKISALINTYNAEEFLERVLETVKDFDEVLICDMHSTDRTIEIAQKYNCRIIYHEHTGIVEPARMYAISQAAYEWVFIIDADELVPAALKDYVYAYVNGSDPGSALRITRKNYYMGRFLRSSYPDDGTRLMRRDKVVEWPSRIHSSPKIEGRIDFVPFKRQELAFIHLANDPIKRNIAKLNVYTDKELIRRKDRKYGWFALIFHPMARFIKSFIMKGGFRDGKRGYISAVESAIYKFVTIVKVIESGVKPEDWDEELK